MIDRKEIELLIRAQLRGERDIASVTKSIGELQEAIQRQAAEAKKGVGSIDDLKASMLALKNAQDTLTQQADTIGRFQKLAEAIQRTEERVQRAGKAYQDYEAKLKGLATVTDAQQQRLLKLSQSFERAQTTVERQRGTYAQLGEALRKAGVDTANLAKAENDLRNSAGQLGVLYGQASSAVQGFATNAAKARDETKRLAEQQRALALEQAQFAAGEKRAADASRARAQAAQEVAEAQAKRRAQAAADRRQFDEQAAAEQRAAQLAQLRADIERRSAEAATRQVAQARDDGLKKTAADAQAAAKQYSTLARASNDLRPKIVSLRDAVNALNDPAKATRSTLAGVEKQVASIASSASGAQGPIKDIAGEFRNLQAAQRALSDQAGLVDGFQRQVSILRQQRAEFVQARAEVAKYAAAVRQGGDAGAAFVKPLEQAQARLRQTAAALRDQITATRQSRDALRDAGVNTANLADAQRRLTESAKTAAQASRQLADATERQAVSTNKAAKGFSLFRDEGRTTLSLIQRIRGEVLALAAAYVGLQGVLGTAGSAIEAYANKQSILVQLGVVVGNDQRVIGEEFEYIRKQAERIGVEFQSLAPAYVKFAAAARQVGRTQQEVRFIFEAFSEVGRTFNLPADRLNLVFLALEQIFSKGVVSTEELRRQLGEQVPGAFQVFADAVKDTFPEFSKSLEQGLVGSENVIRFAEKYRDIVRDQLPAATQKLGAQQARLNNAIFDFRLAIAEGGFADAYTKILKDLTEFFRSDDGQKAAQALAGAFGTVLEILRLLVTNLEEVKFVGGVVAGLFAVSLFGNVASKAVAAATAIKGVAVALTAVQKAMLVFGAFVVGWNIGAYFRDKFVQVELFGIAMVSGILTSLVRLRQSFQEFFFDFPRIASNAFKGVVNLFNNLFAKPLINALRVLAKSLGLDGVASALGGAFDALNLQIDENLGAAASAARQRAEEDLKRIREITDDMADEAIRRRQPQAPQARTTDTTPSPGFVPGAGRTGPTEAEIAKRAREIEALTRALETIEAKIERNEKDNLSSQLSAINTEYQALERRIKALGGSDALAFAKRLEEAVGQLRIQTVRKFNDRLLAEQEALLKKIEAAEAAAGRKDRESLQARQQAIRDSYAATFREIEDQRRKLQDNNLATDPADEAKRRLEGAVAELTVLETQKFNREEIQRREQQINDLLQTRAARIQTIEDKVKAGIITRAEGDRQQQDAIDQLQPQIEALVTLGREFALSINGAFDPIKLQEFLDKLDLVVGGGARLKKELDKITTTIEQGVGQAIDATFNSAYDSLVQLAQGTQKWGDTFKAVGQTILQSLAEILKQIAFAILRQQVLIALGGAGVPVPVAHSGMVVGQGSNRSRNVSPGWFAAAPRYHRGGIVGLRPDEYPAILQKNEEVLSKTDPRNVLNGGLSGGSAEPKAQRFVLVDDRSRVAEAMAGSEGEEVTMVHLRKNIPTLRQLIKGG